MKKNRHPVPDPHYNRIRNIGQKASFLLHVFTHILGGDGVAALSSSSSSISMSSLCADEGRMVGLGARVSPPALGGELVLYKTHAVVVLFQNIFNISMYNV